MLGMQLKSLGLEVNLAATGDEALRWSETKDGDDHGKKVHRKWQKKYEAQKDNYEKFVEAPSSELHEKFDGRKKGR
jgi:hypothetical protein